MNETNEERVGSDSDWWKNQLDKTDEEDDNTWKAKDDSKERITVMGEPDRKTTEDGRKIVVFPVETGDDSEMKSWILNEKYGARAPFKQLLSIARKRGGIPAEGLTVTVIVTGKGKERQYTIVDPQDV